ncbi:hypothetical protein HMPREF3226_01765 [Prevotella corporis]|uniref:Uncharacterized protein n=1 Tax=Prevotella corporis TaxID=28128 RepID=A0A133Q2Q8_9BACT|nr:hypothetical protein HMPREF3226_01765 [Prevotella corporis]
MGNCHEANLSVCRYLTSDNVNSSMNFEKIRKTNTLFWNLKDLH